MTKEELISSIADTIDNAISKVNDPIFGVQRKMLEEIEEIVRDLDYDGDNIKVSAKNLRVIGAIKTKLRRIIMDTDYKKAVTEYLKAFNQVTTLQNQYMRLVTAEFKFTPVLQQIKEQSIAATADSLTEQGLNARVINKIQGVLRTNITTGGSYKKLTQQLREEVTSTGAGKGILERYMKEVTIDAISTYSRQYLQVTTDSLGMDWFLYSGSLKETSRCFCEAMRKKRYFHRAEIPAMLRGDFPEWEAEECNMDPRTKLPVGFIPGTNSANFLTNMGGYNCTHRGIPVTDNIVPEDIRNNFYNRYPKYRPKAPQS